MSFDDSIHKNLLYLVESTVFQVHTWSQFFSGSCFKKGGRQQNQEKMKKKKFSNPPPPFPSPFHSSPTQYCPTKSYRNSFNALHSHPTTHRTQKNPQNPSQIHQQHQPQHLLPPTSLIAIIFLLLSQNLTIFL